MKVIVVGTLGEVVKKLIELEAELKKDGSRKDSILESIAAYSKLYEEWPVSCKQLRDRIVMSMRIRMEAFADCEARMRQAMVLGKDEDLGKAFRALAGWADAWFREREKIRADMSRLNGLGSCVGPAPEMELAEGESEEDAHYHVFQG